MEYSTIEKMTKGDYLATSDWNGSAMRQRLQNPDIKYGYPKEGFTTWMDTLGVEGCQERRERQAVPELRDGSEKRRGALGLCTLWQRHCRFDKFMPADMKDAPELVIPKEMEGHYEFATACPPEAVEIYTKIWTELDEVRPLALTGARHESAGPFS